MISDSLKDVVERHERLGAIDIAAGVLANAATKIQERAGSSFIRGRAVVVDSEFLSRARGALKKLEELAS